MESLTPGTPGYCRIMPEKDGRAEASLKRILEILDRNLARTWLKCLTRHALPDGRAADMYLIGLRACRHRALDSGARQPTNRQPTNQKTSKATSQQTNRPTDQQTNKPTKQQTNTTTSNESRNEPPNQPKNHQKINQKSTKMFPKSILEAILGASWDFLGRLGPILAPRANMSAS